jgi:long-chain fatty acid transport protein
MEYRVNEQLSLRTGYLYDNAAVPDEMVEPSLPDGNRHIYNIGLGYTISNFTIDGSYMILIQDDREIEDSVEDFNGEYKSVGSLYGLSFSYKF